MSVRYYDGPHAQDRPWFRSWAALPWACVGLTIFGQILWILSGSVRDGLTIGTVVTFALASFIHAWQNRGAWWALSYFAIAAGVGLIAESIGTGTGFPFGAYDYTDTLGLKLFSVPVVIPLAWAMMAYPVLLAARTLSHNRLAAIAMGAWLLVAWDFFLDPQMVSEGHWVWAYPTPSLPGIADIPITNFLGWFATAVVIMGVLSLLPETTANDAVPTMLLTWVFASNILANIVFFDRPGVALWGGIGMGVIVIPWLIKTWRLRS